MFLYGRKCLVRATMSNNTLTREERDEFCSLAFRLRGMLALFEADFSRIHGNRCRLSLEHCAWCRWVERFIRLQQWFQELMDETNNDEF